MFSFYFVCVIYLFSCMCDINLNMSHVGPYIYGIYQVVLIQNSLGVVVVDKRRNFALLKNQLNVSNQPPKPAFRRALALAA